MLSLAEWTETLSDMIPMNSRGSELCSWVRMITKVIAGLKIKPLVSKYYL